MSARRVARVAAKVAGVLVTALVAAALVVVLCLHTAPARRLVARQVNRAISHAVKGQIQIDDLRALALFGVTEADVTIRDPGGHPVLSVRGARARVATWTTLRSLVHGLFDENVAWTITLSDASADRVDARLDSDDGGRLELLDAFAPAAAPSPNAPPGRGLHLVIRRIAVRHAHAHGQMAGAPPLDADIDAVTGALDYAPEALVGDVSHAAVVARAVANGADVSGVLQAHVRLPSAPGTRPEGNVSWAGSVGDLAHSAHAQLQNDSVDAVLDVPEIRPETVRSFWAASPVDRTGTLRVEARGTLPEVAIELRARLGQARIQATLSASLGGTRGSVVGGRVDVDDPELDVTSGQGRPEGHARLLAIAGEGALDLGTMTLAARLRATAAGLTLARGATRIGSTSLSARALGGATSPCVDGTLHASDVSVAGLDFTSIDLSAAGNAKAPHVVVSARGTDLPAIDATIDADLAQPVRASARVDGLGAPASAMLEMGDGSFRVRASSRGLDLARVGRLARAERVLKAGTLAFEADVTLERGGPGGHATVDLTDGTITDVTGVSAHLQLQSSGGRIGGKVHVQGGDVGSLELSAAGLAIAGGGMPSVAAWRRASGHVDFAGAVDLDKLAARVPREEWPAQVARGKVTVEGHLGRDGPNDATPELRLSLKTDRFVVAPRTEETRDPDGVVVMTPAPWRLDGIDFDADVRIEGTGALQLSIQAHDAKGELVESKLTSTRVPYADVFDAPGRLMADLRSVPFELHVVVPERGLGGLPDILKQNVVLGRLRADVKATGTLLDPTVDITTTLRDSVFAVQASSQALELALTARYDKARATVSLKASSSDKTLLDAEANIDDLEARNLFAKASLPSLPWIASARAHLAEFPLEAIGPLDDKNVSGKLSGDVSISRLHEDARADCALTVDSLRSGSVMYRTARIQMKADGHLLDGSVRVEQSDGFAEANTHVAASWGSALAPSVPRSTRFAVSLASRNFRIAGLLPFVDGVLDELDGRIDSDARMEFDPVTRGTRLGGTVALSRGTFETAAGGGEFHDVTAAVKFSPDGLVTLEKLSAHGVTGMLQGAATARLDGSGLREIKGVVVIPSHAAIPMGIGGIDVGNMDGRFELAATASEDGLNVTVEVPHLRVVLPQGKSTNVQALGPMDKVQIGAHRGDPATFVLLRGPRRKPPGRGGSPGRTTVAVHLGDVQVVRATDLKVDLDGELKANTGSSTAATGQIRLKPGGTLSIQGKKFTVESGTVTLVGTDPSNPEVVVKASWTAPDRTVVYARFTGPLKTGKVTLTSEPTLSQQEIVELLLYGTAQGPQAQSATASTQNTAVGAVGGEATQPLNHALNQIGLGAVRANIDTTNSANPKPEVEVQIARDISLQVAVVLGQVPPGVNPDHTLLTVDWRFLSRWSLASTVGDAGTTIFDLLWQRRY